LQAKYYFKINGRKNILSHVCTQVIWAFGLRNTNLEYVTLLYFSHKLFNTYEANIFIDNISKEIKVLLNDTLQIVLKFVTISCKLAHLHIHE
jgi:hypothetical protein